MPEAGVYLSGDCAAAAQRILQRCETLAGFSTLPGGVSRAYLTPEHRACNDTVAGWMREAGLQCHEDDAGNIWGRLAATSAGAPVVIVGSHLDSVPNAGKYDGILGVILAIEAAELLSRAGKTLPFHLDIVGFGDEEGTRFGTTLMGSRAVAGRWDDGWLQLADAEGVTLETAYRAFGCDPSAVAGCDRSGENLLAYLEVHIEQGPVLEEHGLALGVVSGIAGARRFAVDIRGQAGHAGTVPMAMRRDALVAAAEIVQIVEKAALEFGIVATVGVLQCRPGAPNVIPGDCSLSLDIRSDDNTRRDAALAAIRAAAGQVVEDRGVAIEWTQTHNASAVLCAAGLQQLMGEVLQDMDQEPLTLVSGAGHDAMSFDGVTDVGMLFLRCAGGISHHPDESVEAGDVAAATAAFMNILLRLG